MKPRFTILTLMGITAYVAMLFAGILHPVWLEVSSWVTYLLVAACIVVAAGRTSAAAVFARGMVLTWGVLVGSINTGTPMAYVAQYLWYFVQHYYPSQTTNHQPFMLALTQFYLLVGALVGWLALWRYQTLERRKLTME